MAVSQPVVTPPSRAAVLLVATMALGGEAAVPRVSRTWRVRPVPFDPDVPGHVAVDTGHLSGITPPAPGVTARLRDAKPIVTLRVTFPRRQGRRTRHDASGIDLYVHETLMFLTYTDETVVVLEA
ncbi:hypothetical protein [Streptomyces sp. NPDC051286]|uniref:hypothetical protein n=1 Tax=Streptomyces sp. NPDC051286 TaxID=3365647 RepID=UPI0037ADC2E1